MIRNIIFLFNLLIFNDLAVAQKPAADIKPADLKLLTTLEDSMSRLAQIAVQDSVEENRRAANEQLLPLIRQALAVSNSFNYAFSKLENISIQQPSDRAFRLFTWQLFVDENHYQYLGFVQLNRSKSTVYELTDASRDLSKPERDVLTTDRWFGAVYYNLKEFKTKDGMKYLLFGYNASNADEHIKVADVLILRGGQIKFGAPVFEVADIKGVRATKFNRLILTYSAEASVRLNFDNELGILIHDHLEQIAAKNPNIPFTFVPDGTYEAFELQKTGVWSHVDKLENTTMSEAPRPQPILNNSKRKVVTKEEAKNFKFPDQ